MSGKLQGVRSKLERAIKHRNDIQDLVVDFADSNFYEIRTELDYKKRVVGRAVNVQTPGPQLGVLIGDYVHCLRSALDQLAYQLALDETRPLPKNWARTSAFPIFKTGPSFRGESGKGAATKIRGVARSTQRIIERLQPYHRRTRPLQWALWQLEELSNTDKHRGLPLTGAVPAQGSVSIKFNAPGVTAFGHQLYPGPLEERRRIIHVRAENIRSAADIELDLLIKPAVTFDRRSEAVSVRGWPLPEVIDGIFAALAFHVFPELSEELAERFGEGVSLQMSESETTPQVAVSDGPAFRPT